MADLLALAKECESAAGPDRSIDGMIAHAVGCTMPDDPAGWPPRYTGSIDAAMTLVPNGHSADTQQRKRIHSPPVEYIERAWAQIETPDGTEFMGNAIAASVPLAVCAAALRTRAPRRNEMPKFRKKPVVIDAVRWRGYSNNLGITSEPSDQPIEITMDNMANIKWEGLPTWLPRVSNIVTDKKFPPHPKPGEIWRDGEDLWIGTLEGNMVCGPGDWIIQGIKGELYPCKPDIFAATYELASQPAQRPASPGPYRVMLCDDGQWMVHTEGDILAYPGQGNEEQKARDICAGMNTPAQASPVLEGVKPIYIKRWRTLVMVSAKYADEIRDALNGSAASSKDRP